MKVRVKDGHIKHDGKVYGPGEVFEVTPEAARTLGESGSIELEPVVEPTQRKAETSPTST